MQRFARRKCVQQNGTFFTWSVKYVFAEGLKTFGKHAVSSNFITFMIRQELFLWAHHHLALFYGEEGGIVLFTFSQKWGVARIPLGWVHDF